MTDGRPSLPEGGRLAGLARPLPNRVTPRPDGPAEVLTPRATVATIQAGYRPLLHPSAR